MDGRFLQCEKLSYYAQCERIAEGAARNSDKEFIHFLYVALGSIAELETQYILSKELAFTEGSPSLEANMERVRKLTVGLIKYLKNK